MNEHTGTSQQQGRTYAPSEILLLTRLNQYYRILQGVYILLRDRTDDLAVDWAPRDETYWREVLDTLHKLRTAIYVFLTWLDQESKAFPPTFLQIRPQLQVMLSRTDNAIDEAGIAVTAYLPHADSSRLEHLRERHATYEGLRTLRGHVQQVLGCINHALCVQQGKEEEEEDLPPVEEHSGHLNRYLVVSDQHYAQQH